MGLPFFVFLAQAVGSAGGDDLKRDLAGIPLLFVSLDDLKRNMAQIPLLFVCLLEFRWAIAMPPHDILTRNVNYTGFSRPRYHRKIFENTKLWQGLPKYGFA